MAAILFMFIIFPCHWAVYIYKIMILQKPFATQFHIDPTVEIWLRVCSNDHAPLTVMPYIVFFKIKNCLNDDLFISCNDRIGKMLHNICISAVAMSLRWATYGPWASCVLFVLNNIDCGYSLEPPHRCIYITSGYQIFLSENSGFGGEIVYIFE